MESEYYQIAIAGAGPAGCATALWTARLCPQLRRRILVLEKQRHPRMKVCAGGLTLKALDALSQLGLSLNIPNAKINHVRLLFENHCVETERPDCMRVVRRDDFDAMLCEAVKSEGIEVHEEEPVTGLGFSNEAWEIRTPKARYAARVLVGADGSRGLTHKLLPGFARYRGVGLATESPAIADETRDAGDGRVTVDFTCNASGIPGYIWHFPSAGGGFNRGIYCCSLKNGWKGLDLAAALKDRLRARGVEIQDRLLGGYGWGYHSGRPVSRRNLLLVGDAAGGNMFTGEGISQALEYGRLAGSKIAQAFNRGDFSFRSYGTCVAASSLGKGFVDAARLARAFYTGGPAIALRAMKADGSLARMMSDYFCGSREFRDLQRGILSRLLANSLWRGVPDFGTACGLFARFVLRAAGLRGSGTG